MRMGGHNKQMQTEKQNKSHVAKTRKEAEKLIEIPFLL